MSESHQADGYNAGYADQLYERRLRERGIVPPSLREAGGNGAPALRELEFRAAETAPAEPVSARADTAHLLHTAAAAGALAEDFRTHGHLLVPEADSSMRAATPR